MLIHNNSVETEKKNGKGDSENLDVNMMAAGRIHRVSTMRKARNYNNQEDLSDAWVFPIGWNRKIDP